MEILDPTEEDDLGVSAFCRGNRRGGKGFDRELAFVPLPFLDGPADPSDVLDLVVSFTHSGSSVGETGEGECGGDVGGGDIEDVVPLWAADGVA